ncbi:hypothetical protein L3X38_001179 [Prunus dulcis]|uniref:Uncharacterized protein n=1 Tax=Prunus dulcis TaxID=3755 RepID=A0AAD4ZIR3_PRUDU|nr:hypothetical protein L3X38_001179 [Prunus dulcis]
MYIDGSDGGGGCGGGSGSGDGGDGARGGGGDGYDGGGDGYGGDASGGSGYRVGESGVDSGGGGGGNEGGGGAGGSDGDGDGDGGGGPGRYGWRLGMTGRFESTCAGLKVRPRKRQALRVMWARARRRRRWARAGGWRDMGSKGGAGPWCLTWAAQEEKLGLARHGLRAGVLCWNVRTGLVQTA